MKITETALCILKWHYIDLETDFIAVIRNTDFKPIPDIGYLATVVSKNDSTRCHNLLIYKPVVTVKKNYLQCVILTGSDIGPPKVHVQLPVSVVSLQDVITISVIVVPDCDGVW